MGAQYIAKTSGEGSVKSSRENNGKAGEERREKGNKERNGEISKKRSGKSNKGKTTRAQVNDPMLDDAVHPLEHQVGLGVDIVEIARMAAILQRTPRFRSRVFTSDEQAYCDKTAAPEVHYATRFAAKEAVLKALGTGFGWGKCDPRNVEVRRSAKGRPFVALHGAVREIARTQQVTEIPLSLSYTHTEAVACAMAITRESVAPAPPEDPMAQLSRQFKELRSLLDDMDDASEGAEDIAEATRTETVAEVAAENAGETAGASGALDAISREYAKKSGETARGTGAAAGTVDAAAGEAGAAAGTVDAAAGEAGAAAGTVDAAAGSVGSAADGITAVTGEMDAEAEEMPKNAQQNAFFQGGE